MGKYDTVDAGEIASKADYRKSGGEVESTNALSQSGALGGSYRDPLK